MSYELRQLRLFLAVCQHGSIAAAARACFMAQPALSRQIRALEHQLGMVLFERVPRGVRLSRAGIELRERAQALLAQSDALGEQLRLAAQGLKGNLRIGVMPGYSWLPKLAATLSALQADSPGLRVDIEQHLSLSQFAALHAGSLDLGIASWRSPNDVALTGLPIINDHMVLALHPDNPLARQQAPIHLAQLQGQTLIGFPRERSTVHFDSLSQALKAAGIALDQASLTASDSLSSIGLVACGCGYAIVPSFFARHSHAMVVFKPLADLVLRMPVELLYLSHCTDPVVARFLHYWHQAETPETNAG